MVRGRRFVTPNGNELIIGCSKQAAAIIGIQYDAWDNQEKMIISKIARNATFLTRVRWLFKGFSYSNH
jgi:predicted HTH transcriptional regulator